MEHGVESKDLLQAQSHVWNHTFSFINSMTLKCAVELGIPDAIHSNGGKPVSLYELANKLSIPPTRIDDLRRLMRLLVHSGFFTRQKIKKDDGDDESDELFLPTINSSILLKESEISVSPFVLCMLDHAHTLPWHSLGEWFRQTNVRTAFEIHHGDYAWGALSKNASFNDSFNKAMASDAILVGKLVARVCIDTFFGLRSVVDVGGGTGAMAREIAKALPQLQFTVLDLPHVVEGLKSEEDDGRIVFVGGDMFEYIPPADAILLKWILHDWNDEDCVKILKRCKEAVPSKEKGGKVIIIDMVMDNESEHFESRETQLFSDMVMIVTTSGKERDEKEWSKIFTDAGYKEYKILNALSLRSVIEVYY